MPILKPEEFGAFLKNTTRSAFRLETLSVYNPVSEAESLRNFLAIEGTPQSKVGRASGYLTDVTAQVSRGVRRYRVHVLESPLGDYLRYEMNSYHSNAEAGEEIFILDTAREEHPDGLRGEDFWLFDDEHVVFMHYREDGEFLHAELLEDPDLEHYRAQRDLAMAKAVPFNEYWENHPQNR